jgi:hypothetical protein
MKPQVDKAAVTLSQAMTAISLGERLLPVALPLLPAAPGPSMTAVCK